MFWRIPIATILLIYISKTSDAQIKDAGNANEVGDNQGGLLSPLISVDPALKDSPLEVAGKTVDEIGKLTDSFSAKVYEKINSLTPDMQQSLFGNDIPPPPESPHDAAVTKRMEEEEKASKDESSGGGLLGKLVGFIGGLLGSTDGASKQVQVEQSRQRRRATAPLPNDIPKEFDSRKKWPQCAKIIGLVDDQALCGSCWAISLAHVLSDRFCIASVKAGKEPTNFLLSSTELMTCHNPKKNGCEGGSAPLAWKWVTENGLVTGGPHGIKNSCQPYPFSPFSSEKAKSHSAEKARPPACIKKCLRTYKTPFMNDKYKATMPTSLARGPGNEAKMMREIMTNGPIQVSIRVYEDLMVYFRGIYKHVTGKYQGGHSVRLIGWGEQKGIEYWIVANSWNSDWGEDGFFRIIRGQDSCNIESFSIDFAQPLLR